jgi:ribosome maturation factor RimP
MGEKTTLEVSSPGVERPLRTPEHFRRFVGKEVAVKAKPGTEGERRLAGVLEAADEEGVVVAGRRLAYAEIERARTVFVWPQPAKKKMGRAS